MTERRAAPDSLPMPPAVSRAERFFRRWAETVLRFRYPCLLVIALVTAGALHATRTKLRIDNSTEAFLAADDDSTVVLEELRDTFGQDTLFQVLAEGDVFTLDYLTRLKKLHQEIDALDMEIPSLGHRSGTRGAPLSAAAPAPEARPEVADELAGFGDDEGWGQEGGGSIIDETISLVNVRQTRSTEGGIEVSGLLDDWPTESELPGLERRVLADKTLVGQVIGKKATHSVVIVRTAFMNETDAGRVYQKLLEIAARHERPGFHLEVAGAPALFVALNARMLDDLALTFITANALMLLILLVMFRHPIGVLTPLVVCVQAAVCTMGALAISGRPMTMITNVLPSFLMCVGIGDSIHIQSVYRDARKRGMANHDAIVYAIGSTGVPVLLTSLTTAVGLYSFRFAHLPAIQDMGVFGAFGVMVALLSSLVLLPIALSWNKKHLLGVATSAHERDRLDGFLALCNDLSRPRARTGRAHSYRRHVLVLGTLLGVATIPAAFTLRVFHNPLRWFPEDDPLRSAVDHMDDHVGGMATIALLISAPEGQNLKSRDTLVALEKLERHIFAYRDPAWGAALIGNATSLLDVVRESWRAVHDNDPAYYKLPDDQRGVLDMLTLFENASPAQLSRLATVDLSRSLLTVRARWIDAWSYRPLVEHIDRGVREHFGGGVTVRATGTVYSTVSIVATLLLDLLQSFGTAFVVITLFMMLLLADLKLGLIAMVPNLLPILMVMGYMKLTGTPVDSNTLLVASIAIGIAVDDTIHFLHQWKNQYAAHGDVERAIDHAFSHTGRAMVSTSAILVTGFMSLNVGYMGNVRDFGTLISITVVFALLFDLIFCPALLRTVYRTRTAANAANATPT